MATTLTSPIPTVDPQDRETPDPYTDSPELRHLISERIDKAIDKAKNHRTLFEREWMQNILVAAGHHWIIFDRRRGQWRQRGGPEWFPKPVTNKVLEKSNDNIASVLMTPPEMSWEPRRDDAASIAAAESADQIDETIGEEVHRKKNDRVLATWLVLTGNAFIESYYDNSPEHGTTFLQHEECQTCGYVGGPKEFRDADDKCPQCGGAEIKPAMERIGSSCPQCREMGIEQDYGPAGAFLPCPLCEARNQAAMSTALAVPGEATAIATSTPTLQPTYSETKIGEQILKGKMCEMVRSPFEIFFDHVTTKEFSQEGGLKRVVVSEVMDYQESKEKYGVDIGSSIVTPAQGGSLSLQYLDSLHVLTSLLDPSISPVTAGARGSPAGAQERVLRETMYELPTKRFPLGLKAIRIQGSAGKVVEFGPLETHLEDEDGRPDPNRPFIPIVHLKFHPQAGRVWGRTPISDIVPLNIERNMARALQILCERRMGNPVWVCAKGTVERDPTGEPGEIVWYTHLSAGQGRPPIPQRLQGLETPRSLSDHIRQLDEEIERISGSFDIAHGEAPRGVTAASALALLGERQQRSVSPQVQAWELANEERARQQMLIFKEYGTDARVRARRDGISKWAFEEWSAADLGGSIMVRVIPGSAMPKSRAQLAATVEAEIKMGVVDTMNPEVRRKVHEIYGTPQLVEPYQLDVKDAQRENELFLRFTKNEQGGKPLKPPRALIDNHQIHMAEHIQFAKSDEFMELEEKAEAADAKAAFFVQMFYSHLQQHLAILNPPIPPAALPAPGAGAAPPPGPGRPEGTGPVFNAGKAEPEGESRVVSEPPTLMPS